MFQLITNPSFVPRKQFARIIFDPHDASKDRKVLRERAEAAFRAGILNYDLADGTYYYAEELRP